MLEFATPFHTAVGKLKSPTSANFDPAALQDAYNQLNDPQPSDESLLEAAPWLGSLSATMRALPKPAHFEALDAQTAVMLAIAAINQTFLLIRNHIDQSLRESLEEGVQSITYMSARPLSGAFEDLSADDATDIAVDSAESWLFDAYAKKRASAYDDGDIDLLSTALHTLRQYSTQGAINDLWN